jgi:CheY-like chemotaxis protein
VPQTLLLADDSVTIQRVIELTFQDEDIKVVAVSDGDQAIARLNSAPPDIVLADIGMPGKNGYEVAQYVKKSPGLAHIPVVLLTGAFEPVDQAKAAEAGCDGVLAKPFEPQLVIARVKELLGRPRSAGTSAPSASIGATTAETARLDNYFDQLDAAFSNLSGPAVEPEPLKSPAPVATATAAPEIDWFGSRSTAATPAAPAADLPLAYAPPQTFQPAPEPPPPLPVVPPPPPAPAPAPVPVAAAAPPAPVPPPPVAPLQAPPLAIVTPRMPPPLADAFAALLAAEQNEPLPPMPSWPSSATGPTGSGAASSAIATDDLVEQVTRRVLERLSNQVVRDTVADIVSQVAERLVREEIERIKSSIK